MAESIRNCLNVRSQVTVFERFDKINHPFTQIQAAAMGKKIKNLPQRLDPMSHPT